MEDYEKSGELGKTQALLLLYFERMIFMEESLLGLLTKEDGLVKKVNEAHDMSEFYEFRADEWRRDMYKCDCKTMSDVFQSDMEICETKSKIWKEKETMSKVELDEVREKIKQYILLVGSNMKGVD